MIAHVSCRFGSSPRRQALGRRIPTRRDARPSGVGFRRDASDSGAVAPSTMSVEQHLRARLGAARLALDGREGVTRASLSKVQAAAVREIVGRSPGLTDLSAERRASLLDIAAAARFAAEDEAMVMMLLSESSDARNSTRRPMQNFSPAFLSYFVEAQWADLLDPQVQSMLKFNIVQRCLATLSGRNLSEFTLRFVASFFLFIGHGEAALRMSTGCAMLSSLAQTKTPTDRTRPQ